MKFRIDVGAFERGEIKGDELPIKIKENGRMLFLKPTASALLDVGDDWTSFDEATGDDSLKKDFRDALTALRCFGLAEVADGQVIDDRGCRVAWEKDYKQISKLIIDNAADECGFSPRTDNESLNESNVRARQFNNMEYNFLKEADGKLMADLVVAVPSEEQIISAATISAAVFDADVPSDERGKMLSDLLWFAQKMFAGEFAKFRFCYTSHAQDWLLGELIKNGFTKTCVLKNEILNSVDLTLYDKMIG